MPLKLLKRTSKQYNVVSKSTFVISVELLDCAFMECTLDTDATGKDCILNISQRLNLHQIEFFGLRYISRGVPPRFRWVDLERPLKKQLEKHAQDSQLSLGVMFYVADVNLLKDEMTRYHYFLQLKNDVIDGKLNYSIDQAISLAAYSLQAEFGDYDRERHTIEYLRDFIPQRLGLHQELSQTRYADINIDALYEAVTTQYRSLVGFPPPLAEIYYIMVAQQLDGYGQEAYPAKDFGNDVLICVSAKGLVIRNRDWSHIQAFRWSDIKALSGHKKNFTVEPIPSHQSQRTMQFSFTDSEVSKYVRKMCILQSKFYKNTLAAEASSENMRNNNYSQSSDLTDSTSHTGLRRITPDLIANSSNNSLAHSLSFNPPHASSMTMNSNNTLENTHSFDLQFLHQSQQHANTSLSSSSNVINGSNSNMAALHQQYSQYSGALMTQQQRQQQQQHVSNNSLGRGGSSLAPLNLMAANSEQNNYATHSLTPTTTGNNGAMQDMNNLLPTYRSAPSYQTALQMKYGHKDYFDNQGEGNNASDDEEEPIYQNQIVNQLQSIELSGDSLPQSHNSTQELNGQATTILKLPPPYPTTAKVEQRQNSNLTPDLTSNNNYNGPYHHFNFDNVVTIAPPILVSHNTTVAEVQVHTQPQTPGISSTSIPVGAAVVTNKLQPFLTTTSSSSSPSTASLESTSGNKNGKSSSSISMGVSTSSLSVAKSANSTNGIMVQNTDSTVSTTTSIPSAVASTSVKKEPVAAKHSHNRRSIDDEATNGSEKSKNGHLYGKPIDPNILREFQSISRGKPNQNFTTALKRENMKRNRCPNILPYEDNAIRVSPSRHNPSGYINASPVKAHIAGKDWKYIVGQIPLNGNICLASIWQMVWETNAKIIAALERDTTAPFYPCENGSTMSFNDFQITESKGERGNTASIAREFTLTYLPKKKQRKVWVLPYEEEWKDDVPIHTEHFLCFLEEVNSIQRKVSDAATPLVVLCRNGGGRSGVLLLADLLLHAADCGHKLSVDKLLSELRMQRMMLVSSPPQYAFVLRTLEKYLAQSRLI